MRRESIHQGCTQRTVRISCIMSYHDLQLSISDGVFQNKYYTSRQSTTNIWTQPLKTLAACLKNILIQKLKILQQQGSNILTDSKVEYFAIINEHLDSTV